MKKKAMLLFLFILLLIVLYCLVRNEMRMQCPRGQRYVVLDGVDEKTGEPWSYQGCK
jgi:hypothetical protein